MEKQPLPIHIHTIAIFPKIQPDTVAALFLLQEFGEKLFPGAATAQIVFWTAIPDGKTAAQCEAEGILPIDLGGTIDHHVTEGRAKEHSAATLIAKMLGVEKDPSLQKLLAYVKRDDLEGKGTISEDPLDRSFGLSGLMTTCGRVYQDSPDWLVNIVLPLFRAHVAEQRQRIEENPREWKECKASGKGKEFPVAGKRGTWRVAFIESDNISLPGFLRAYLKHDVVIQRLSSRHVNIITNQKRNIDLRPTTREVRLAEARRIGVTVAKEKHSAQGRIEELPMWFFDVMANTLQNGGIKPQGIVATVLTTDEIIAAVRTGLSEV
jgi:hypothetical protein